jgi:hypothetical protein
MRQIIEAAYGISRQDCTGTDIDTDMLAYQKEQK